MMRFERYLIQASNNFGDKTAVIAGKERVSYRQLNELSDRLATALVQNGVERNDRVLVFMDNCLEAAVSVFAILKAGAVFSFVTASTKAEKLASIIDNCEPAALLAQAKLMREVNRLRELDTQPPEFVVSTTAPNGKCPEGAVSFKTCIETELDIIDHKGIDSDLAMLIYTSGTTGYPKGVMMSHRNVDAVSESVIDYLKMTSDDVILSVLPMAFSYGLYQLLMSVRLGATLILEKSFAFPYAVFDRIREEKASVFPLVPTIAAMILQMKDLEPGFLPSLRLLTNAAAALPAAHIERLQLLFPDAQFYSMYGQTECKRSTYLPPDELSRRPDSVGIAIPNTEAYVVNEHGQRVLPGIVGELVVRGPHVMQGYWCNEQATADILKPGDNPWEKVLYTGDLFRADDEGFLYFVGRKDDIIKTRGEKVAPKEVEAVLHAHPQITEAVVVGLPDSILGSAISALVIKADPALTEKDVIRYCSKHLEDFMVPKTVSFRTELPRTESGKVSRRLAAELAQTGTAN